MRRRNWRAVTGGIVLNIMALGFFFIMSALAPQSMDPVEMMRIVGQASGIVVGISLVLIVIGLIGKKV